MCCQGAQSGIQSDRARARARVLAGQLGWRRDPPTRPLRESDARRLELVGKLAVGGGGITRGRECETTASDYERGGSNLGVCRDGGQASSVLCSVGPSRESHTSARIGERSGVPSRLRCELQR